MLRMLLKPLRKALQKLIAPSMEEDIFQAAQPRVQDHVDGSVFPKRWTPKAWVHGFLSELYK